MRSNWLYLQMRSVRHSEPVLIWPALVATAMSAIVVSSVSPDRWADDGRVLCAIGHLNGFQRLRERSDLVDLDQDRVGHAELDALRQELRVGDEKVVADQLAPVPELVGDGLPPDQSLSACRLRC